MLLLSLLIVPIIGIFIVTTSLSYSNNTIVYDKFLKKIGLATTIINFLISLFIYLLFDFSSKQFQFVQEFYQVSYFNFYLGIDGLSIYFILLTTFIIPISLLSN
jgi:NADH:ubiquinone oxidoreductase subunit 4 (subunit M)